MSQREWERPFKELKESVEKNLEGFQSALGTVSSTLSDLQQRFQSPPEGTGATGDLPIYKCKGPGCHFSTEELDAYVDHVVGHRLEKAQTAAELEPSKAETKRHRTAREFVDCPECRGALLREFEAAGWVVKKPEEKPQAEEKKRGLFR